MSTSKPPAGTGPSGRRLWKSVLEKFTLEEAELALLREAVRTVDVLDELAEVIREEGTMTTTTTGERKVHPAVVESRQLRLALARTIASLRLPEDDDPSRPQRRGAARGVYSDRRSYGKLTSA